MCWRLMSSSKPLNLSLWHIVGFEVVHCASSCASWLWAACDIRSLPDFRLELSSAFLEWQVMLSTYFTFFWVPIRCNMKLYFHSKLKESGDSARYDCIIPSTTHTAFSLKCLICILFSCSQNSKNTIKSIVLSKLWVICGQKTGVRPGKTKLHFLNCFSL